jgi:hypothetical protein
MINSQLLLIMSPIISFKSFTLAFCCTTFVGCADYPIANQQPTSPWGMGEYGRRRYGYTHHPVEPERYKSEEERAADERTSAVVFGLGMAAMFGGSGDSLAPETNEEQDYVPPPAPEPDQFSE